MPFHLGLERERPSGDDLLSFTYPIENHDHVAVFLTNPYGTNVKLPFRTLDEAVAYALEVEGYRELWLAIIEADWAGALSAN